MSSEHAITGHSVLGNNATAGLKKLQAAMCKQLKATTECNKPANNYQMRVARCLENAAANGIRSLRPSSLNVCSGMQRGDTASFDSMNQEQQ